MDKNGIIGEDLGPLVAGSDEKCMAAYMSVPGENESVHQESNSLGIVLCRRADPKCESTESNTHIMHIYQHKFWHGFHGVCEPYIMLIHQTAPFRIHGITKGPIWFHGRGPRLGKVPQFYDEESKKSWNQTGM